MSELVLELEKREKSGSGYANKIRREGKVPGIFYFHGKEAIPFIVSRKSLQTTLGKESALLDVAFNDGDKRKCIVRNIQFDPITHSILHVDLMGILLSEKITVSVPIHLIGTPIGVKNDGGILQLMMRDVEIECLPTDIPEFIELDVTNLNIADSLHLSDIQVDKFKILGDLERAIATVSALRVVEEVVVAPEAEEAEPEVITAKRVETEEGAEGK